MVNLQIAAGITSKEIINFLKPEQILPEVIVKILSTKIVKEVAEKEGITISLEEIQAESHHFRSHYHLETTSDLIAWLVNQGICYEDWEHTISDRLLAQKLATYLFDDQVEAYFIEHQTEFQQVLMYRIIVPFERVAADLFYQIEEQEFSFFEAAHLYDIDQQRRLTCGYEGWVSISDLPPELFDAILNANLGEVIPPVKTEAGYNLMLIEQISQGELNPGIRQKILNKLFQNWLNLEVQYRLQKSQIQEVNHQFVRSSLSKNSQQKS
jgi:hypothetical protein